MTFRLKGDEMRDFDGDDELVITGVGVISVWQGGSDYAHVQASIGFRRDPRLHQLRVARAVQRELCRRGRPVERRPGQKYCIACGDWKSHEEFTPDKRGVDGLHAYCKPCRAKQQKLARIRKAKASVTSSCEMRA